MTEAEARKVVEAGDRFTGGGILPWAGMPGWDEKSCNRYHRAQRVLERARVLRALRSWRRISPRLEPRDARALAVVAWAHALSPWEVRLVSLYLRGPRVCARFDVLSGAVQEAIRTVEKEAARERTWR